MTYTETIFAALGDQQPLDVLAATPGLVEAIVRSVDPATLAKPEKPGKWSMVQVVRHLADVEVAQGWRFRMVMAEDHPAIQAYDQDLWIERLWLDDGPVDEALASWTAARAGNLRLLRSLKGDDWKRAGLHSERGEESLDTLARLTAGHDIVHRRQLERIRAAVTASS